MDKYAFGNRLYALRTEKGYTQEKLGKMLGVSNKAISKWENGTTQPRLEMLDKIAACFDISVEELLEYGDPKISYDNDGNGKKELNTNAVTEISKLPKISMKMISGLGFLRVDAQQFIKDIKAEKQLTNKDIAIILGEREKTIGLWENGLKQPNALTNSMIAAFYYNNCDEQSRINNLVNTSTGYSILEKIIDLYFVIFTIPFFLLLFPILISDEAYFEMYAFKQISSFSFNSFFAFLLPVAVITCSCFLLLKSVRLNRPNIKNIIANYRVFLALSTVYTALICLIFAKNKILTLVIIALGICVYLIHYVNIAKLQNNHNMIIRAFLILVSVLVCLSLTDSITEEIWNTFEWVPYIEYDIYIDFIFCHLTIAYLAEYLLFETNYVYETVKPFFPQLKTERVKLPKRDIAAAVIFIVLVFVFFLVMENNKEFIFEYEKAKFAEETTTLLTGLE